jgi:hypothetical protein
MICEVLKSGKGNVLMNKSEGLRLDDLSGFQIWEMERFKIKF